MFDLHHGWERADIDAPRASIVVVTLKD